MPVASPPVVYQQPSKTMTLQQPGSVAPNGATVKIPVATPYDAAAPNGAIEAPAAVTQPRAAAANSRPQPNAPPTGVHSLWQTFLGSNPPTQNVAGDAGRRPVQYPPANVAPVMPTTAGASRIAESLAGQFTGVQPGSATATTAPATTQSAASETSISQPTINQPSATAPARSAGQQIAPQQVARRLPAAPSSPEVRQTAGTVANQPATERRAVSAAFDAPLVAQGELNTRPQAAVAGSGGGIIGAGDGPARGDHQVGSLARGNSVPYASTGAPASAIYPPGTIPPPPAALGNIQQSLANSTRQGGALAGLWPPATMTTNQPVPGTPSERAAGAASAPAIMPSTAAGTPMQTNDGNSAMASLMFSPFQLQNGNPAAASSTSTAGNRQPEKTTSFGGGSLFRQLAMTMNGESYASEESLAESESGSKLLRETNSDPLSPSSVIVQTAATEQKGAGTTKDRDLVALMQELAPEPADLDTETGELVPEAAPEGGQAAAGNTEAKSLVEADKLGEAPENRTLDFLRQETVLLKPGESQCDVGISYIFTDNDFPILLTDAGGNLVGVADVRFMVRELTVPMEYRVGLTKRVQGFVAMPVGWANTQINIASQEEFRNDGGIGDSVFGLTIQCVEATVDCPYVITTISGTAPTGGDPFTGVVGISPTAPSLGDGFWSVNGTVLFIQQYDPVVLFYGLGLERSFPHEYIGIEFLPGAQYSYLFGVGFAVNERITLSTRFFGSYVEELEANGNRVLGTNTEPMQIRMSATISKPKRHKKKDKESSTNNLVEPFVEFGLNDDSVNTNLGITWTF